MSAAQDFDADVIVVGAGPVGLTISNTLGQYGVKVLLLEKGEELIDYPRAVGARQDSCHLSHAAKGCLFVLPIAMATTDSRSGLSVTGPAGDQLRVWRDQRAGWRSRASTYNA